MGHLLESLARKLENGVRDSSCVPEIIKNQKGYFENLNWRMKIEKKFTILFKRL